MPEQNSSLILTICAVFGILVTLPFSILIASYVYVVSNFRKLFRKGNKQ